jgi:hypothetical protein
MIGRNYLKLPVIERETARWSPVFPGIIPERE